MVDFLSKQLSRYVDYRTYDTLKWLSVYDTGGLYMYVFCVAVSNDRPVEMLPGIIPGVAQYRNSQLSKLAGVPLGRGHF